MSDELGAPLGNVSYHVRQLVKLRLVVLVKETRRRGAIEHHYAARSVTQVRDAVWAEAAPAVKNAMLASAFDEAGLPVIETVAVGGLEGEQARLARAHLVLDERGWSELAQAVLELNERAGRIAKQSERRLKQARGEGRRVAALVMLLFEFAPSVAPASGTRHSGSGAQKRAEAATRSR